MNEELLFDLADRLERPDPRPLLWRSRQDDGVHVLCPAEVLEGLREERVRVPVVERHVGRRAQDDEHARRVDAEAAEQRAVGLEVGEVVLLLQARVLLQLRRLGAVGGERDRVVVQQAVRLERPDDAERLERGAAVFEGLYAYISSGARSRPAD